METTTQGAGQEQNLDPQVPEQAPAQNEQPEIDYKAEFEKAQEKLKKAEYTLYKKNVEDKAKKQEEPKAEDLEAKVAETVNKRMEKIASDFTSDAIESALETLSDDNDERELIRLHYENSIQRTGFSKSQIFEDMQKAKLLANAPKYLKQTKELSETLKSKRTTSTSSMGTNVDAAFTPPKSDELKGKFNARDWDFMKSRGWSDEQIRKAASLQNAYGERELRTPKLGR